MRFVHSVENQNQHQHKVINQACDGDASDHSAFHPRQRRIRAAAYAKHLEKEVQRAQRVAHQGVVIEHRPPERAFKGAHLNKNP